MSDSPRRAAVVLFAAFVACGRGEKPAGMTAHPYRAAAATAAPTVTQVIDGIPQVVARQQLIVSCDSGLLSLLCTSALGNLGATIIATGQGVFNLVQLPDWVPLQSALDILRAATGIATAEPNRILIASSTYPQTWHFPAIQAPGDSSMLPAGVSPLVAVIDSGIAYESDFLGVHAQAPVLNATAFAPGWDFVNNSSHPDDDNGHGTAMASIIAGQGTFSSASIPYVGPAAGATLMPVKVLNANNQGTEFWLEEGIRYAVRSGAQVINLSLDFARNYVPGAALRDAIAVARAARVVIVGASGNTGDARVLYPAAFPDVISVGAFRPDATSGYAMTSYSNSGEALDIAGPGGMPGQDVNQDGLWDGVLAQSFPPGAPTDIGWWLFAGTSPATAHVTAAAAVLIGNGADADDVLPLLQATAAPLGATGWNPGSGSGRVQTADALNYHPDEEVQWPPKRLYADAVAALRADGRAAGAVMIADAYGNPVQRAEVHVRWRGAATDSQTATTDWSGIARFVSPAPTSSRKIFLIEVPRVIYRGATQRPLAFARSRGILGTPVLGVGLSTGGEISSVDGLNIWGYGFAQETGGSGLGSGTTGSGLGSGTTGSTGGGGDSQPSYPLTTGISACVRPLHLYSYGPFSYWADSAFFSGAPLARGYSVRAVDSSWVLAPGAAALDLTELGNICGVSLAFSESLSGGYFTYGTLYVPRAGSPPAGMGAGDNARFWSEIMNAENSTAP